MTDNKLKLTKTMLGGLDRMERSAARTGTSLGWPNENTARALERRGLVKVVGSERNWLTYEITEEGRDVLARNRSTLIRR